MNPPMVGCPFCNGLRPRGEIGFGDCCLQTAASNGRKAAILTLAKWAALEAVSARLLEGTQSEMVIPLDRLREWIREEAANG